MKKLLLLLLLLTLSIAGCTQAVETDIPAESAEKIDEIESIEPINVSIAGLKGPTSMGMIQLFENSLPTINEYTVDYTAYGAPDELIGKIINGEVQIAAVPTNLASVLYNKTEGKIQLLAINTLGVIHVVGSGEIDSLEDLKGKTLYVSGKGSTPDFAVNYMLDKLGLSDDVTIEGFTLEGGCIEILKRNNIAFYNNTFLCTNSYNFDISYSHRKRRG